MAALEDWKAALAPHYDEAERMLGVVDVTVDDPADELLHEFGDHIGVEKSYAKTRVGVYFGEPGVTVDDPFFGGEGPPRTGCEFIGALHGRLPGRRQEHARVRTTSGSPSARRAGPPGADGRRHPRRSAPPDGSDGYEVVHERSGAWLRKDRQAAPRGGVVVSAGALGTNRLLQLCKRNGSLRVSDRLGELVRTNSEAILAVTAPDDAVDITKRVAISGSIYPDPDTHIETVSYGGGGDSMSLLYTLLVGDGTRSPGR